MRFGISKDGILLPDESYQVQQSWRTTLGPTIDKVASALNIFDSLASATFVIVKEKVAERTRLELATSGVTGRRSNQLSYRSISPKIWRLESGD